MMRKFPKYAWMSFCHGVLGGAPSCANFPFLRKQGARGVGLSCRMTRRRGLSGALDSTVDQNQQLSCDRVLAITASLPRCIHSNMAMIDETPPTAKPSFLKTWARPFTHASGYNVPRRRAQSPDDDRQVRPPLQRSCAANLTDMHLATQIWGACPNGSGARMRTGSRVASSPSRTPVGQEQASGWWRAKPMPDSWVIPIKWASVPELQWKSTPCRSSLDAPRSH